MQGHPILYSFRRCPYAMRARMAIYQAKIKCELREVLLKDKPESMLSLSSKGTVPVLLTPDEKIIDESLEVMSWALAQNDPEDWLKEDDFCSQDLIEKNDNEFKYYLDRYKYHVGYPEHSQGFYRDKTLAYLELLEQALKDNEGVSLSGNHISFTDIAIFPFIRQFANVDLNWFTTSPYEWIKNWYVNIEQSKLFQDCMHKYKQWSPDRPPVYFP